MKKTPLEILLLIAKAGCDTLIWLIVASHLLWGVLAVREDAIAGVTAIIMLGKLLPLPLWGHGVVYLVACLLCLVELYWEKASDWTDRHLKFLGGRVALIAPQVLLTVSSAYGSSKAISLGEYLDGTTGIPAAHILADQHVYLLLAVAHFVGCALWWQYKIVRGNLHRACEGCPVAGQGFETKKQEK